MDDIYADRTRAAVEIPGEGLGTYQFVILGNPAPDLLLRISSQLLLTNTLPTRLSLSHVSAQQVIVEAEVTGIPRRTADSIHRKLRQLSCAESVSILGG